MPKTVEIVPGVVFWPLPTPETPQPHPWVVVSPVIGGKVLAINLTDYDSCPDKSCAVEIGEYPTLKKKSAAFFQKCRSFPVAILTAELSTQLRMVHCTSVDPQLLERLRVGIKNSVLVRDTIKIEYGLKNAPPRETRTPF